jgi:hypothetical protein
MFLLPALGAWITDGLVLYIYFSNKGAANPVNYTQQQISPGINHNLNVDIICAHGSHCRQGFALDDVLDNQNLESITDDTTIHRGAVQQEDIFAAENSSAPKNDNGNNNNDSNSNNQKMGISTATIESETGYLAVLAIIRLLLLTFPLSYAAYYGTKVPCVVVQFLFHGITAMVVVSHMLAVLIVNPSNIDDMPGDDGTLDPPMILGAINDTSSAYIGDAWTLLSLSLVSILLHFLIVLHVRSTGPTSAYEEQMTRKRKKLAYAMNGDTRRMAGFHGRGSLGKPLMNGQNGDDDDDEEGLANGTQSPLLLPEGINTPAREKSIKERLMCLPDQYEAFVSEAQLRLDNARRMWSHRLEVMTSNHNNSLNKSAHGESNGGGVTDSPGKNLETFIHNAATNASKLVPLKPDPFRVLLQLFAYEDVWTNDRLDLAFSTITPDATNQSSNSIDTEGSTALAFYAPQLLSFLLHGAYLDISAKLEEWILKKCGQDLHFAHRCFWFLRAWCLGNSSKENKPRFSRNASVSSMGGDDVDFVSLEPLDSKAQSIKRLRGVEPNLYLAYSESQGTNRHDYLPPVLGGERTQQLHGLDSPEELSSSKFSPDERVLIEQLLCRVIECGSRPAYVTQFGSIDGTVEEECNFEHDDIARAFSPSALATSVEKGLVPVDPRTGWHSKAHLDAIASPRNYGFLPLHHSSDSYQKQMQTKDARSLFFASPLFLDALLSIADDLMQSPRPNRTTDLQQRLRGLEVELLPSNVVYLPIRNMHHRVWRIVADESIALSTNERVPCIVALEVINYGSSASCGQGSDRAITSAWVDTPREPKRHSTLIDKVANFTQERLRRLEDTIDHFSHHGDGKSNLERRLSEYLGPTGSRTAGPLYTPIDSSDDSSQDDEEAPVLTKMAQRDSNGFEMCTPPPPLGSPRSNNDDEDGRSSPTSQYPMSILHYQMGRDGHLDPPLTPLTPARQEIDDLDSPMGQWSTPRTTQKRQLKFRKRNTRANSIVEEERETDTSPQAKQRKVAFPPSSENMSRSIEEGAQAVSPSPYQTEIDGAILKSVAPAVVFKEDWNAKTERLRKSSIYGSHPGWRLLPILVKSNDDLRQEQVIRYVVVVFFV